MHGCMRMQGGGGLFHSILSWSIVVAQLLLETLASLFVASAIPLGVTGSMSRPQVANTLPVCGLQPDAGHAHSELILAAGGLLYLRHAVLEGATVGAAEAAPSRNDQGYAGVHYGDGMPRFAHGLCAKTVHTAVSGVQHVHEKATGSCSLPVD